MTFEINVESSNALGLRANMSSELSATGTRLSEEMGTAKTYTNESGYVVDIEKVTSLIDICRRGICHIETSTGASGTGALYNLLAGIHTLMTNHHVIRTTEVAEVIIMRLQVYNVLVHYTVLLTRPHSQCVCSDMSHEIQVRGTRRTAAAAGRRGDGSHESREGARRHHYTVARILRELSDSARRSLLSCA